MRIGWLADQFPFKGGAEYESDELRRKAPNGVQIIDCTPEHMHSGVDVYVIHNCGTYKLLDQLGRDVIECLSQKPVVKRVHDVAMVAEPTLRAWLIENAKTILCSSPQHVKAIDWGGATREIELVPSAINVLPFQTRMAPVSRVGTVWLGRIFEGKGIGEAAKWARRQHSEVDVYGFGPMERQLPEPLRFCGALPHESIAEVLMQYERFVFLPSKIEPFGRTAVEAWLAGCELVLNENVGALWWLINKPDDITCGAEMFWKHVMEAVE